MIDHKIRAALKADIAAHLLTAGGANWSTVRDRYPTISAATFWRTVRTVKIAQPQPPGGDGAGAPQEAAAAAIAAELDLPRAAMPWLGSNFSAAQLFAEHDRLLKDAEMLRASSLDALGNVVRPATFLQSVRLREKILSAFWAVQRELPVLATWERLYCELGELLRQYDKDFQRKLVEALRPFGDRIPHTRRSPKA